jgi:hypothetical protein
MEKVGEKMGENRGQIIGVAEAQRGRISYIREFPL